MSNRRQNLNDVFPAGSTAVNAIKTRIESEFSNNFQINLPVLTINDMRTILNEQDKRATKRFWIGIGVTAIFGIIGIIISITYL